MSAPNLMELTKPGIVSSIMSDENLGLLLNSRGRHSRDPILQMRIFMLRLNARPSTVGPPSPGRGGGAVVSGRSCSTEQGSDRQPECDRRTSGGAASVRQRSFTVPEAGCVSALGYGWKGRTGHCAAPSYHTGGKLERAGLVCRVIFQIRSVTENLSK